MDKPAESSKAEPARTKEEATLWFATKERNKPKPKEETENEKP